MFTTYLPIRWVGHVLIDDFGKITLLKVEFYSDFGPFRVGDTVPELMIDFVEGRMVEQGGPRKCAFVGVADRRLVSRRRKDDKPR